MIQQIGCILCFTNSGGEQFYSIIVDVHPPSGFYGIRADDGMSDTTLWIEIDAVPPGVTVEILPADTPVRWRSELLLQRIESGEIARLIEKNRRRLLAGRAERLKERRQEPCR